jgi:hypothetical protein
VNERASEEPGPARGPLSERSLSPTDRSETDRHATPRHDASELPLHEPDEDGTRSPLGSDADGRAIYLDSSAVPDGAVSASITGLDTGGPRPLALYRVAGSRLVRVAEGWSDVDGTLHFPGVLVPDQPLSLVVRSADETQGTADRSDPAVMTRSGMGPPRAEIRPAEDGALAIRLVAARAVGSVVIARGDGTEIGRFPLPSIPNPTQQFMDVRLAGERADQVLLVAQELPDGTHSGWRAVQVPAGP